MTDDFESTVDTIWFRDVGLYRIRAIPTPLGFVSFRQLFLIGIGVLFTVLGVKATWGSPLGELISMAPTVLMFWLSTKRIGMILPETQLLAYLAPGQAPAPAEESAGGSLNEPTEDKVLEVAVTESKPGPFAVSYSANLVRGKPRDAVLIIDGEERARTPPARISGSRAHYVIRSSVESSETGVHNVEVRLDGSDKEVQKFRLIVKSTGVDMA